MGTFLFIAVIIFIILAVSGNSKKNLTNYSSASNNQKSKKTDKQLHDEFINNIINNIQIKVSSSNSVTSYNNDDSIIDVTGKPQPIYQNSSLIKYEAGVPFWTHHYVYSANELKYATKEQTDFYNQFKYRFLKGQYLELEGNSNYAFILLFDLIDDYETHKNLPLVERQLEEVGKYYPKTHPYALSSLIKKIEIIGDQEALARLRSQQGSYYQYRQPNPEYYYDGNYWGIGTKYKAKLKLTDEEVKILNKLFYSGNNFCSIEYCFIEVLKIYLSTIEELKQKCLTDGTTLDDLVLEVADIILQRHFKYKLGSNNYKYGLDSVISEIYSNVFKRSENTVREHYGHKRKINTDTYYTTASAKEIFEAKIINPVAEIQSGLIPIINPPDEPTEIQLYAQSTNRWKIKFEEICSNYKKDNSNAFTEQVLKLAKLNKKNPSVENIFFDASKFIAKSDKVESLKLYIYYLDADLKSVNFDNKQFTKTIQKSLFANNEQLHDFEKIIGELVTDKNLDKALDAISKFYQPKRKKIQLDTKSIIEVQQQHSGTVELLNEYLKDEYEGESSTIKSQEISTDEIKIEIVQKNETVRNSFYLTALSFNEIQMATLDMFAKNNFTVDQTELEDFARSNAVFKNQLIESINETCYEFLDDILIEEEEEEFYIITQNYYQRLLTI